MGRLFDTIRAAVLARRYLVGQHAAERLDERGILEWQIVDGIEHGEPIAEDPSATPNPAVEVRQTPADGTPVKAVWSYVKPLDVAKLVTRYTSSNERRGRPEHPRQAREAHAARPHRPLRDRRRC